MTDDDVVIVAAGNAWPLYQMAAAYLCQPGRRFRDVSRLGFYSQRTIHGAAPAISTIYDDIVLSQAEAARRALSLDPAEQRLGNVIAAALTGAWKENQASRIVILSPLDSPETIRFDPIKHLGSSAWTQQQRYTTLTALTRAATTADLTSDQS